MPEFHYARGRISESLQFIMRELKEFEDEYADKTWQEYQESSKLQKLIDRTVENILTALIEICGTILTEENIVVDSYSDALKKTGRFFGLKNKGQESLAKLAIQRNRLAHWYLNFRWQAVKYFEENKVLIKKLLSVILKREAKKRD